MENVSTACDSIFEFVKREITPNFQFTNYVTYLRVTPHFDPNKSGYDLLVSKGVGIVLNDSLRQAISVLYESSYTYYKRYEDERIQLRISLIEPYLIKYFIMDYVESSENLISVSISNEDYTAMTNDKYFEKLISAAALENDIVLNRAKRTENSILKLHELINNELSK